ncbi:MAG: RpiB/LacA/LacB family sugar-phosphate isomerase [Planctomycetota bacterium]|nr:RpiB/LacA/LacB family sugar-phosphate isomerase [Planctomycetota bacterium]MDP6763065.1 RpiB/LacA/LacB family sugar-phosphate isomerase [Planctomycetota bacterium]MDP6989038.1 RpiB/LacA/LacB family sugar-phosphate isomerase [Planctomycetota bacterium]
MSVDVDQLVRRVVARVLSERGMAGGAARVGGVHVDVRPAGEDLRPGAPERTPRSESGARLWSASEVALLPDGATISLEPGAIATPLAREEARRRRIRIESGSGGSAGRRLRVAVGSDHGGFELKGKLLRVLGEAGHHAVDMGCNGPHAVDYPDFALAVARAVAEGRADFGIAIDGAGIGSAIAANKVPGVRAAMCPSPRLAANAREHNFANVLSLAGDLGELDAAEIVGAFLATPEGACRHERRVAKIADAEGRYTSRRRAVRRVLEREEG